MLNGPPGVCPYTSDGQSSDLWPLLQVHHAPGSWTWTIELKLIERETPVGSHSFRRGCSLAHEAQITPTSCSQNHVIGAQRLVQQSSSLALPDNYNVATRDDSLRVITSLTSSLVIAPELLSSHLRVRALSGASANCTRFWSHSVRPRSSFMSRWNSAGTLAELHDWYYYY